MFRRMKSKFRNERFLLEIKIIHLVSLIDHTQHKSPEKL
jgi:hypothetical protein